MRNNALPSSTKIWGCSFRPIRQVKRTSHRANRAIASEREATWTNWVPTWGCIYSVLWLAFPPKFWCSKGLHAANMWRQNFQAQNSTGWEIRWNKKFCSPCIGKDCIQAKERRQIFLPADRSPCMPITLLACSSLITFHCMQNGASWTGLR